MGMKRMFLLAVTAMVVFWSASQVAASTCVDCHKKVTPGIVEQHESGAMSQAGIDCSVCHGDKHQKMDDAQLAAIPTPATCAKCHEAKVKQFNEGNHAVMTSWGFLAVRLPEDDAEWMVDRATILQGLGVLDEKGEPTARLEIIKAGKVARLTKEGFQGPRDKMQAICSRCHSPSYAKDQLDQTDQLIKAADKLMAEAIRIVQVLYKDGILTKPEGWTFAPDLLQFYDAQSSIEQELHVMFLEHRMRTFQGAFHANFDYSHWYGWAPMKESLQKIKDEALALRADHK